MAGVGMDAGVRPWGRHRNRPRDSPCDCCPFYLFLTISYLGGRPSGASLGTSPLLSPLHGWSLSEAGRWGWSLGLSPRRRFGGYRKGLVNPRRFLRFSCYRASFLNPGFFGFSRYRATLLTPPFSTVGLAIGGANYNSLIVGDFLPPTGMAETHRSPSLE